MNLLLHPMVLGAVLALGATVLSSVREAHAATAQPPATATAPTAETGVTLYVQKDCGYCARARQLLDTRGITYTERDIADATVNADWRALGGQGVPLLVVGTTKVHGFDPPRIEAALATLESGAGRAQPR
jgi:glutaredoxin